MCSASYDSTDVWCECIVRHMIALHATDVWCECIADHMIALHRTAVWYKYIHHIREVRLLQTRLTIFSMLFRGAMFDTKSDFADIMLSKVSKS